MNQFDPKMMVMVLDVTEGVPPDILYYNYGPNQELRSFEPNFDLGVPSYSLPRDYAERQLENAGGRTFLLYSPNKLIVRKPNGRGGTSLITLKAVKKGEDGKWIEKTDAEIESEGAPAVNPVMEKAVAAANSVAAAAVVPEPVADESESEPVKPQRGRFGKRVS